MKNGNSTHDKNIAHCSCPNIVRINNRSICISYILTLWNNLFRYNNCHEWLRPDLKIRFGNIIFISARSQWEKHEKYIQTIKHTTNLDKCSTSHNLMHCAHNYIIECQMLKLIKFSQTRKVLHKETKHGGRH